MSKAVTRDIIGRQQASLYSEAHHAWRMANVRVALQASNEDDCLLYRLANFKLGGELIDAYNVGGQAEVEKLIREQFGVLMYNDGKGQVIKRAEYLRWKFRDVKQVSEILRDSVETT